MKSFAIAFVLACALTGCVRHYHTTGGGGGGGSVHVHDDGCGHCWDGDRWIVINRHRHGPGCGHYHHSGGWHVYPAHHVYTVAGHGHHGVHVTHGHVHDAHCGHSWDGARWVHHASHVHRTGCGHHFHSGGWHLHPVTYRHTTHGHGHLGVTIRIGR
ncbi:MAG: hypothetical protein FD180_3179 [Planctomycetota bacterium]|nr:MAG: hypothetical protein FD180_3179 [Planctomycetota bacterium]